MAYGYDDDYDGVPNTADDLAIRKAMQMAGQAPGMGVQERYGGGSKGRAKTNQGSGGAGGGMMDPRGMSLQPLAMNEYGAMGDPTLTDAGMIPEMVHEPTPSPRQTGTVDFYNGARGFGFITPEEGGKDQFVGGGSVPPLYGIAEGDRFSYTSSPDPRGKGPMAQQLIPEDGENYSVHPKGQQPGIANVLSSEGMPDDMKAYQDRTNTLQQIMPFAGKIMEKYGYPPDPVTLGDLADSNRGAEISDIISQYGVTPETQQIISELFDEWMAAYSATE